MNAKLDWYRWYSGSVGEFPIDCNTVLQLGWALGNYITQNYGPSKVLIGKDTRISGYLIESLFEAGLIASGCEAMLLGPIPTPGIAYLIRAFRARAGVVSASQMCTRIMALNCLMKMGLRWILRIKKES